MVLSPSSLRLKDVLCKTGLVVAIQILAVTGTLMYIQEFERNFGIGTVVVFFRVLH